MGVCTCGVIESDEAFKLKRREQFIFVLLVGEVNDKE